MEKILKYIIVSCGVLLMTSCEKFLERYPHDIMPSDYYENEAELTSAIIGVYDKLGGVYGTIWLYRMGHEADEGFHSSSSLVIGPQNFNFSASHNYIATAWRNLYEGIYRANFVLKYVDKNTQIPRIVRNRIRGEALCLRGHFYSVLVHLYGGVPLILEPTTDGAANMNIPRNSVKEVYEQVLEDLEAAEKLVPAITEIGHGGRVSKSAVRGMLARVCLYMAGYPLRDVSKYEDARHWAKKVIDDPEAGHELNPDFSDIFIKYARDEYDIKESIWEVEFWGNRRDSYTETGYVGFANGPNTSNPETGNGYGGLKVTAKLYLKYNDSDLRRDWTIANFTYNSTGPSGSKTMITNTDEGSLYDRRVAKWRREYETLLPKATGQTPQNFPLLRFSDVLLMYAEADFYASGEQINPLALEYINLVRRRGFGKLLPGATDIDAYDLPASIDPATFEREIRDERMRELAFEQMRKFDLIRWGVFMTEMREVVDMVNVMSPSSSTSQHVRERFENALYSRHLIWPIPAVEIMMNRAMKQNPNW
ncbi:RagB/SusD family nutrient uptake outer membrane protein [Parapedobacter sp. SGR-10]|uniref:RagB/SusD family nutrient uptake outer membrane protein n=1 Tax=Parapedobacter sp. SGR-10 TaxID=2710879 RepID=UPI0013D2828C|nr:RagB/SusD family nutrient uptake outer membrane protein [Parapedobacter sp. SGR-10]NGF56384.1 RagB/SusD family nutrient uptake outer membrane protein [Parapedobacter sp. SGR-10]